MLETIVNEAFFFLSGFTFANITIHTTTVEGETISLTLHGGQTFLNTEFVGRLF